MEKGIYLNKKTGKYIAQYWNFTEKTTKNIGSFKTKMEAITARNTFLNMLESKEIDDSGDRTKGLPKGISELPNGTFTACVQFIYGKKQHHVNAHIGTYPTKQEAVDARTKFIMKLL